MRKGEPGPGLHQAWELPLGGLRASHPRAPRRLLPPCPTVCGEMLGQCPLSAGSLLPGFLDPPQGQDPTYPPDGAGLPKPLVRESMTSPARWQHPDSVASLFGVCSLRSPCVGPRVSCRERAQTLCPRLSSPLAQRRPGRSRGRKVVCSGHVGWCGTPGSL